MEQSCFLFLRQMLRVKSSVGPSSLVRSPTTSNAASVVQNGFNHIPAETKIMIIGKPGFSSAPVVAEGFLKELGYQGNIDFER